MQIAIGSCEVASYPLNDVGQDRQMQMLDGNGDRCTVSVDWVAIRKRPWIDFCKLNYDIPNYRVHFIGIGGSISFKNH